VLVVVGQQHQVAAAQADRRLAGQLQLQLALGHVVVGDEMAGRGGKRMAVLRPDPGDDAPGRAELRIEKEAATQVQALHYVGNGIHGRLRRVGGSGKSPGAPRIVQAVPRA
jgi:hypothetical protein